MGARTVYRYFPDRASSAAGAAGPRLREATQTRFPETEEEIVPLARTAFQEFEANEAVVRAILTSPAGDEVRERGGMEGRAAFTQSLASALDGLEPGEQGRIIAVFVSVYSASFWQLLRDRGLLSGPEAEEAVTWTLHTLLGSHQVPGP